MAGSVGFIGLDKMGRPMALNLMKQGFPLVVHDVDPAKVEPLRARGILLVLFIVFLPKGILGSLLDLRRRMRWTSS